MVDSLLSWMVQPLTKIPGLDPTTFPSSFLNFFLFLKSLKRLSIIVFCGGTDIQVFQSSFKNLHHTESALLGVLNDVLLSSDSGDSVGFITFRLSCSL